MAKDPAFGLNGFGQPKIYSESETLANGILTALLAKPASYPSLPNFGMNVAQMVFLPFDEIDVTAIKNDLVHQCSYFNQVIQNGQFDVQKREVTDDLGKKVPLLIFIIPTIIRDVGRRLVIGVQKNGTGISYNFTWME